MRRDLRQHGAPVGGMQHTPKREQVDGSCGLLCVHAASRNLFGLQPASSFPATSRFFGTVPDTIHTTMLRSLLLLWAACTGRVSATWVCGGSVEITKSWDGTKRINGHCEGKPNLPSPRA